MYLSVVNSTIYHYWLHGNSKPVMGGCYSGFNFTPRKCAPHHVQVMFVRVATRKHRFIILVLQQRSSPLKTSLG